jgi:DNA-binding transcriptional LysR family regulator
MSYLHSLSVFAAVAEEGSFSGAAKKLNLTQPTISFHIDNLEKEFGCPLFQRTAKGSTLTVYGEILLNNTYGISAQMEETRKQIKTMVDGSAGKITLGASTVPAEYILPKLLAKFMGQYPDIRFSLQTGDSQSVLDDLRAGKFPIAVLGADPGGEFVTKPLWQDELVLVAHSELKAQLGDKPTLAKIFALPFVARAWSSGSTRAAYSALTEHGVSPNHLKIVLEVGGNEALKTAVANKLGIGFISRWAVQQEIAAGLLATIPLPGIKVARKFFATCRQPLIPACIQCFWDYLITTPAE